LYPARFGGTRSTLDIPREAALAFALCAATGKLLVPTLWATCPKYLIAYFGVVNRLSLWLLKWSGLVRIATDVEKPLCRFVIDPSFMALTLSGPLTMSGVTPNPRLIRRECTGEGRR